MATTFSVNTALYFACKTRFFTELSVWERNRKKEKSFHLNEDDISTNVLRNLKI